MDKHRLRYMVDNESDITDLELNEIESKIDYDIYQDEYEYCGNFILTKNIIHFEQAVSKMCCGIVTKKIIINDAIIYFAFDYGH